MTLRALERWQPIQRAISALFKLSDSAFMIAINGGTGRYDEAQGQISARDLNDTDTQLRFDID